MKTITADRADIIHFAGFHHLSPALDDRSRPVFSASAGDKLSRCGWERFFKMVSAHRLAMEYDPEDPGSARFIPRPAGTGEHSAARSHHPFRHARRFCGALFPRNERKAA